MRTIVKIVVLILLSNNVFSQIGEKRVALVIGNKDYQQGDTLTYTLQDAKNIKDALEDLNFEVIYRTDASRNVMNSAFLDFIRTAYNANISLIYYSGHGMQIDGINHLIPVDANIIDGYSAKNLTVNVNDWVNQLEGNEEGVKIVILDACRNNPFKAFTKGNGNGLHQMPAPSGTIISFATLADNVAQDNGIFAVALATEMRKPQRLIDVFINTRNIVEDKTDGQQSPMEWLRLNDKIYLKNNDTEPPDDIVWFDNSSGYFIDKRDGHKYKTVKIGNQIWMAENLTTTKFNDGTAIPLVTDNMAWDNLRSPSYCWYNNNKNMYGGTYGALYNWFAVETGKLCPCDWHVPTVKEWNELINYVGGDNVAWGKLKETGTIHWDRSKATTIDRFGEIGAISNTEATNESGFTALPGGSRVNHGEFHDIGTQGYWWFLGGANANDAWLVYMNYYNSYLRKRFLKKHFGLSVRCVRD